MKAGEEYQILGIRVAKSKDGKLGAVIHYCTPFEEWETTSADRVEGFKTDYEYTREESVVNQLEKIKVNDVVTFSFRKGYQGSAVVSGITVVKPAGK